MDEHGWWRTPATPSDVLAFVNGRTIGRAPCGLGSMRVTGSGSGTGSVHWVQCSFPRERAFTLRWLWFEARRFRGYTLVRVDAVVAWGFLPTVSTGTSGSPAP